MFVRLLQSLLELFVVKTSITLDNPTGAKFAFRAVSPPDAEISSIHLELTGGKTASQTLNAEPWSLYGDDEGDP